MNYGPVGGCHVTDDTAHVIIFPNLKVKTANFLAISLGSRERVDFMGSCGRWMDKTCRRGHYMTRQYTMRPMSLL